MRSTLKIVLTAGLAVCATVALATPAQAAVAPKAVWNMNSLPTMVDDRGGDNNGTTANITMAGAGKYQFNGINGGGRNSLATVPDKANLNPGSATIQLSARLSFTTRPAVENTYDIVRKGVSSSDGGDYKMEIYTRSTGAAVAACSFKDANGVSGQSFGTVDLAGKGMQTITCIKTPTSIQVVAGGETRTSNKALGPIKNTSKVYVGGKGDGTDTFAGVMDFVKISIG